MAFGNSTMTYDQLGSLAANLLHKAFIETTRTVSKGLFRRLEEGETVGVTRLEFEGDETVQLNMTLDVSQYRRWKARSLTRPARRCPLVSGESFALRALQ